MKRIALALVLFTTTAATSGCEQLVAPVSRVNFLSVEQEAQVSAQFAGEVRSQQKIVTDAAINAYVNDVGQRLAATLKESQFRYTFGVVADPAINAFNIGGGYVFLHTGLIAESDTEGQVASVLAHEIGHQVERHVAKAISRQQLFQSLAAVAVGPNSSQWIQLAASLGITTGDLYFGREAEREADAVMVELMVRAGYDPREALGMFGKLQKLSAAEPGTVSKIFSSHPPTSERIENVRKNVEGRTLPANLARDSARFQEIRKRVRGG
jgi:beta-barrel assembly-enhancing protease